jgi:hypothetical protein
MTEMQFLIQSPNSQAAVVEQLKAAGFAAVASPRRVSDEELLPVTVSEVDDSQIGEVERIVADTAPPPNSARIK